MVMVIGVGWGGALTYPLCVLGAPRTRALFTSSSFAPLDRDASVVVPFPRQGHRVVSLVGWESLEAEATKGRASCRSRRPSAEKNMSFAVQAGQWLLALQGQPGWTAVSGQNKPPQMTGEICEKQELGFSRAQSESFDAD